MLKVTHLIRGGVKIHLGLSDSKAHAFHDSVAQCATQVYVIVFGKLYFLDLKNKLRGTSQTTQNRLAIAKTSMTR